MSSTKGSSIDTAMSPHADVTPAKVFGMRVPDQALFKPVVNDGKLGEASYTATQQRNETWFERRKAVLWSDLQRAGLPAVAGGTASPNPTSLTTCSSTRF